MSDKDITGAEFRVYHIPQVPMTPFHVTVASYAEGLRICGILGDYDLFQLEHRVKPDYSNVNSVEWRHPQHTDGWEECDEDTAEYFGMATT